MNRVQILKELNVLIQIVKVNKGLLGDRCLVKQARTRMSFLINELPKKQN